MLAVMRSACCASTSVPLVPSNPAAVHTGRLSWSQTPSSPETSLWYLMTPMSAIPAVWERVYEVRLNLVRSPRAVQLHAVTLLFVCWLRTASNASGVATVAEEAVVCTVLQDSVLELVAPQQRHE